MIDNISDTDLAYIAGYFDGEGCVLINGTSTIQITIVNTYKPTLEWLKSLFNGSVSERYIQKEVHRVSYSWQLSGNNACIFLETLLPFLREKKKQAELAILFHKLPRWNGVKTSENNVAIYKKKIIEELKTLKKVRH